MWMRCTGPITYTGHADLKADIDYLKAALERRSGRGSLHDVDLAVEPRAQPPQRFYRTGEEYLAALADAMHVEYKAIVDAGFILQIDDPRMATHYDRTPDASIEECRKFIAARVEAVNYALRGIPEDRVRFHTCYSVNVAPRVHDLELRDYVDLMLQVRAGAYSIEAANPRHEHEWQVFEDVKLPDGKILIPGVVSHCVALVEHPELVAQRLVRFATRAGTRKRHRQRRLRLRHVGGARRGASRRGLGEARGARRRRTGSPARSCGSELAARPAASASQPNTENTSGLRSRL